jgi:hypothetical protein
MKRNAFTFWIFAPLCILFGFLMLLSEDLISILLYMAGLILIYFIAIKILK